MRHSCSRHTEFAGFEQPFMHIDPDELTSIAGSAGLDVTRQSVVDRERDFGSRDRFAQWCTVGRRCVQYVEHSPYCRDLVPHGVSVLFFDAHGTLIGGMFHGDTGCPAGTHAPLPIEEVYLPPATDRPRIAAYPYCDPASSNGLVLQSPGDPGNQ